MRGSIMKYILHPLIRCNDKTKNSIFDAVHSLQRHTHILRLQIQQNIRTLIF